MNLKLAVAELFCCLAVLGMANPDEPMLTPVEKEELRKEILDLEKELLRPNLTPAEKDELRLELAALRMTRAQSLRVFAVHMSDLWQRGHFILEGNVVDETGKPVPTFSIEHPHPLTEKSLAELAAWKKRIDRTNKDDRFGPELEEKPDILRCKDGRFRLDAKYLDSNFVGLLFRAEGYHETPLFLKDLTNEENVALELAIIKGVTEKDPLPNEILIKRKMTVVMRRKTGETTKLQRSMLDVELMRNGDRNGIQFSLPKETKAVVPVRLAGKKARLPARSIFLSVKRDDDGAFLLEKSPPPVFAGREAVPVNARLILNSAPGDGFIKYEKRLQLVSGDPKLEYKKEPVRRGMRLAPEKGYQLELPLSAAELSKSDDHDPVMFYFKCGGRYGRAEFAFFDMEKDQSKIRIHLKIELQPDGSRNLNDEQEDGGDWRD